MEFGKLYETCRPCPAFLVIGFLRRWNEYWFRPAPLVHLAICRIVLVAFQLFLLIHLDLYNYNGFPELTVLPDYTYDPLYVLRLFIWPFGWDFRPSLEVLLTIYWITLATGALALIGLKTQLSLMLFAVGNILMMAFAYSFGDFHHPEALMIIALSIFALSPAGKVWSIDNLWRRRLLSVGKGESENINMTEKDTFARWPLLLMLWMFALAYLDGATQKIRSAGFDWMNGYNLEFILYKDGLARGSGFAIWLAQQHTLTVMLSWIMILFEATFFLVLIFPRLSWVYIPTGVALHVGMCMTKIACFHQYFALYVVFIPLFFHLERWLSPRILQSEHPIVFFDGICGLCNGFVTWVVNRDPEAIFRFAPLQAESARNWLPPQPDNPAEWSIVLVDEGGVHYQSDAILRIMSGLGGVYRGAALLIWIPKLIRDRMYKLVASNRYNWFGKLQECRVPTAEERSRFLP